MTATLNPPAAARSRANPKPARCDTANPSTTAGPPGVHPTEPLDALPCQPPVDALPYLSDRDRRRSIRREEHPTGPYLLAQGLDRDAALLPLSGDVTYIGRGQRASLSFDERTVSHRHAIVLRHARATRVLDDRSTNGVFVNGQRLTDAQLHHGDVLRIGRLMLTYLEL